MNGRNRNVITLYSNFVLLHTILLQTLASEFISAVRAFVFSLCDFKTAFLRACLHGGGEHQVGEVTRLAVG